MTVRDGKESIRRIDGPAVRPKPARRGVEEGARRGKGRPANSNVPGWVLPRRTPDPGPFRGPRRRSSRMAWVTTQAALADGGLGPHSGHRHRTQLRRGIRWGAMTSIG